jgi:hypothetical protein
MSDKGKLWQLKNRVKEMIQHMGEVQNSRAVSLARTNLDQACMWLDYELRTLGEEVPVEAPPQPVEYTPSQTKKVIAAENQERAEKRAAMLAEQGNPDHIPMETPSEPEQPEPATPPVQSSLDAALNM